MPRQNTNLGFYLPSFFRLHLSTDNPISDLNKLIEKDLSIFFHEYIHFIQDISTYYGLNNIHATVEYFKYANMVVRGTEGYFKIPIEPDANAENNVGLNKYINNITYGDTVYKNIKKVLRYNTLNMNFPPNSILSEGIDVFDIEYLSNENVICEFQFGACCIMESMANILERFNSKNFVPSPDIPYNSAEKLANFIYPDFANNILNILALCDMSLNLSNPSKYFIRTLEKWKAKSEIPSNPKILYDEFYNGRFKQNEKKETNFIENLEAHAELAISQLKSYFNDPYFDSIKSWISFIIKGALDLRKNNRYFIIDLATGTLKENYLLFGLINKLGTPLITNNRNDYRYVKPTEYKHEVDIAYFWAISQIHKLFSYSEIKCDLFSFCNHELSNVETDDRCDKSPWRRGMDEKGLCPYGLFWRHWGLNGHAPQT